MTEITNLDRLRAVTEHVRHYVDLAHSMSSVSLYNGTEVLLTGQDPRDLTQWAVSVEGTEATVKDHGGAFILDVAGTLAGGRPVKVTMVFLDPSPLKADGIEAGQTVSVDRLATLGAVRS